MPAIELKAYNSLYQELLPEYRRRDVLHKGFFLEMKEQVPYCLELHILLVIFLDNL